jgi:hypothetical protein
MRKIPHVLLPEDELALLGDEVEKVIKHRWVGVTQSTDRGWERLGTAWDSRGQRRLALPGLLQWGQSCQSLHSQGSGANDSWQGRS